MSGERNKIDIELKSNLCCETDEERLLADLLIWSSWVRTELTTLMASDGSVPDWEAFLAAVRLSTCPTEHQLDDAHVKKTTEIYL